MKYLACLLITLLLVACGQPAAEVAPPTPSLEPPTATAAPTATATTIPTPEPLTAGDIFERLSPSVAYVRTEAGSGSGALLPGGYVLTNAHVVWPYEAADVTFPDGTKVEDAPLLAQDTLRDIAVLGPIDVDLPPVTFAGDESLAVGGDILLIGYPGESDEAPQPTLSEGLISRVREWEQGGLTFFQTSSAVAGGQSGGIAVLPGGEPFGLSGHRFTEANYGLIASAADLMPLVEELIAGAPASAENAEPLTVDSDHFDLTANEPTKAYRVAAPPDTPVAITIDGPGNVELAAYSPDGQEVAYVDDTLTGEETLRFTTPAADVPLFFVISYLGNFSSRYALTSDQPLIEINDLDDGMPVNVGASYVGTMNYPYDTDPINILLDEGQEVTIHVDTIGFDPLVVMDYELGLDSYIGDDDSGGGLFGTDAEFTYRAPNDGLVSAFVFDPLGMGAGSSYTITVSEPDEGAPTAMAPTPTPTPIAAAIGPMRLFDEPALPFTFEAPFTFTTVNENVICHGFNEIDQTGACLSEGPLAVSGLTIMAVTEDAGGLGLEEMTLEEYVAILRSSIEANPALKFSGERAVETADGRPAVVLEFTTPDEVVKLARLVYVHGGQSANSLSFFYAPFEQEMVDYVISTFRMR